MNRATIISPIKIKNYNTVVIDWRHKTITDLVNEVIPKVKNNTILAGYSIGGTVALILAQTLNLKKLILYSPSPLFKEKVNTLSKSALNVLGKKRLIDAKTYSIREITNNIKIPVDIYIGEKEIKVMISFAKYLHKRLDSSLIVKEECCHRDLLKY